MMVSTDGLISTVTLRSTLRNHSDNYAWPEDEEDYIGMQWKLESGTQWSQMAVGSNNFIQLPLGKATRKRRKGHGKRKHYMNCEAGVTLALDIVLLSADQMEESDRVEAAQLQQRTKEKRRLRELSQSKIDDLSGLMDPFPCAPPASGTYTFL